MDIVKAYGSALNKKAISNLEEVPDVPGWFVTGALDRDGSIYVCGTTAHLALRQKTPFLLLT